MTRIDDVFPAPTDLPSTPAQPKPRRRIAVGAVPHLPDANLLLWLPYLEEFAHWEVVPRPIPLSGTDWLEKEHFDGCILNVWCQADADRIQKSGIPTVNTSGALEHPDIPTIRSNDDLIGRMAANHLIYECALEHLAYVGPESSRGTWSTRRALGFNAVAKRAGIQIQQHTVTTVNGSRIADDTSSKFTQWLQNLPKPVGIMAGDDWTAMAILSACGKLGLLVPHDVAVIGVNDDPIASIANPPLTSINRNASLVMLESARLLDRLMNGAKPPAKPILIPPAWIVKRESTDIIAIGDPVIAAAARTIRDKLGQPFSIDALAAELGVSTRTLQRGFAQWLHCSPLEYVARVRVEHSKTLLRGNTKIGSIAAACGFASEPQFRHSFKRINDLTPQEYRDSVMESSKLER